MLARQALCHLRHNQALFALVIFQGGSCIFAPRLALDRDPPNVPLT
jgi:hypothetical protein